MAESQDRERLELEETRVARRACRRRAFRLAQPRFSGGSATEWASGVGGEGPGAAGMFPRPREGGCASCVMHLAALAGLGQE
ncbi:hypothetical protein CALCODRAFT_135609 [Calocera cornea HHB12733]|nr:hypothetical protein CALCODRAFT_135609 [Calocera cornea HHB12733]